MKRLRQFAVIGAAAGAIFGILLACEHSAYSQITGEKTSPPQTGGLNSEAPKADATPLDPSKRTAVAMPADATPDKVVSAFLDAIRRGDNPTAVSLLSTKAHEEYRKNGFVIALPGSPQAKVSIGKADYGTPGQDQSLVLTQWTQPNRLGEPQMHEVSWHLRKEPDGYRIVESAMSFPSGSEPLRARFYHDIFDAQEKVANFLELINGPGVFQQTPQSTFAAGEPYSRGPGTPASAPVEQPAPDRLKVISLQHAPADNLAETLRATLRTAGKTALVKGFITIVADQRTNSLIATGSDADLSVIEALAAKLDVPGPKNPWGQKPQAVEYRPGEREVFAQVDGVVTEVLVKTGDDVKAGQELVKLKSPELDLETARAYTAATENFLRIAEAKKVLGSGKVPVPDNVVQMTDQLNRANALQTQLEQQLEALREKQKLLVVRSPIDGKVVTWNLRENLIERPVAKGESLMRIAIKGSPVPVSQAVPSSTNPNVPLFAPEAPPTLPSTPQYYSPPQPYYAPVAKANSPYQKAEQKASKLAAEYHELSQPLTIKTVPKSTPTVVINQNENRVKKQEELKIEIRCEVELAFKARQKSQQAELEALRKKLSQIETSINNREQNREAIINRRVEELINPEVKWDSGAALPQAGNPLRANAPALNPNGAAQLPAGTTIRQVPVTTAREVDTPDGKKMVYEESMREEVVYGELPKSTAIAPANSSTYQQSAPAFPSPPKVPDLELDSIQGKWLAVSVLDNGKAPRQKITGSVITKDTLTFSIENSPRAVVDYTIDRSQNPTWIDFWAEKRHLSKGIYELNGDELIICLSDSIEEGRPTAFESKPDSVNCILYILKREKGASQAPKLAPALSPPKSANEATRRVPVFRKVKTPEGMKVVAEMLDEADAKPEPGSARAAPPAFQNAQEALQGKWKVLLAADEGEIRLGRGRNNLRPAKELTSCVFADNKMIFDLQDGSTEEATFKLTYDHNPCWIDIEVKGRVMKGIYELNDSDGILKICYPEGQNKDRSTAFESEKDSPNDVLLVLQRHAEQPKIPASPLQ